MMIIPIHEFVSVKLKNNGYDGLFADGECACEINDLMPCGECQREPGEEYVNGCSPGYKHIDPKDPSFWCISQKKEPPSEERWEQMRRSF